MWIQKKIYLEKKLKSKQTIKNINTDARFNVLGKKHKKGLSKITSSGTMSSNSEIKDIVKVIRSLENKGIFIGMNYWKNS